MKKAWLAITTCLLAVSCSSTPTPDCIYNCAPSANSDNHHINGNNVLNGNNNHIAITKTQRQALLKYFDGYRTRAHIDFNNGKIYVLT